MKQLFKSIGVVWYKSKEDFLKARAIFTDTFLLPDTYEEFLVRFAEITAKVEAGGGIVVKAEVNPETFSAWCKERFLNVDANGRAAFASEAAVKFDKKGVKL